MILLAKGSHGWHLKARVAGYQIMNSALFRQLVVVWAMGVFTYTLMSIFGTAPIDVQSVAIFTGVISVFVTVINFANRKDS